MCAQTAAGQHRKRSPSARVRASPPALHRQPARQSLAPPHARRRAGAWQRVRRAGRRTRTPPRLKAKRCTRRAVPPLARALPPLPPPQPAQQQRGHASEELGARRRQAPPVAPSAQSHTRAVLPPRLLPACLGTARRGLLQPHGLHPHAAARARQRPREHARAAPNHACMCRCAWLYTENEGRPADVSDAGSGVPSSRRSTRPPACAAQAASPQGRGLALGAGQNTRPNQSSSSRLASQSCEPVTCGAAVRSPSL